jgi:hypothetical protein
MLMKTPVVKSFMSSTILRAPLRIAGLFVLTLGGCDSGNPARDTTNYPNTMMAGTTGGVLGGAAGMTVAGMTGGSAGMSAGTGGTAGIAGAGGAAGGMTGGAGGMTGEMSVSGIDEAELAMLRDVCVDEINRYRATLSLAPIDRASVDQELCSDRGAKMDGDSQAAHGSAGTNNPCNETGRWDAFPHFGAQNTCPNWSVGGGFGGFATIADALKGCLEGMWNEGEPPQGTDACIEEYRAGDQECFLAHGHYINMKANGMGVSCGFYKTSSGKYWMNQDFY